jgi:hypothetical protein
MKADSNWPAILFVVAAGGVIVWLLFYFLGGIRVGSHSLVFYLALAGWHLSHSKESSGEKVWMVVILSVFLLCMTNPSQEAHFDKAIEKQGWTGRLVTAWSGLERKTYLLFSLGKQGEKTLTFGILGHVFWVGGK